MLTIGHSSPAKQDVNSFTGRQKSAVSQQQISKVLSKNGDVIMDNRRFAQKFNDRNMPWSFFRVK